MDKIAYSITEVAEVLGVSTRTVHRLISREELTAAKVGKQWRITRLDLHHYLNERGSLGLIDVSQETQNPSQDDPEEGALRAVAA